MVKEHRPHRMEKRRGRGRQRGKEGGRKEGKEGVRKRREEEAGFEGAEYMSLGKRVSWTCSLQQVF